MNRAVAWPMQFMILTLAAICCSCDKQDTDRLVRMGRKVAEKMDPKNETSSTGLSHGWQAIKVSWSEIALDTRVSARLRWDKNLTGADIQARSASAGVVELKGTVHDVDQRRRAVELAESTAGVERVVDSLEER